MMVQAQEEIVNTLGSGEDSLKLKELIDLYTKLSDRVLDLETTKTAQAKKIASLKKRVKKLERKRESKTPRMKRLFKIGRSAQVVSSEDEGLGDQEDASKQGRKIDDIDQDADFYFGDVIGKLQAEEEEQARLGREKAKKVEEANISWDNVQAMIEADRLFAERLQAREQEELTDKEKARLFVELLEKRKKHFAALRAQEKRNKPPTKAQKKTEAEMEQESSLKRAGDELEQEKEKKQKIDDDQEEVIVDWKIVKEGKISLFQIIRANGSSKRVHFERFQDMLLFMLVEKRYPLTPATIIEMLNKKLQTDHLNEMCYQLLKLRHSFCFDKKGSLNRRCSTDMYTLKIGKGYLRKGQKRSQKRQNQARERKERERKAKSKPEVKKTESKSTKSQSQIKSKSTPGSGFGKSVENRTRKPILPKVGPPIPT
ncbi:hypothetical protein Tco_0686586 [Tanacetum coccineum]